MQGRPLTAARPSGNGGAKLFTLLVVLLPLTYQIASPFPFLSLGELVLVPFVFVLLVTGIRDGVYSPAALSVFYLVPIGATFVDFFLYSGAYLLIADSFTVMARILFYYALIVVSTKYFAKDFALKCYWGAIVVLMAVLVAQLFAHYALGFDVPIVQELGPALFAPSQYADTDTYYHMYGFGPPRCSWSRAIATCTSPPWWRYCCWLPKRCWRGCPSGSRSVASCLRCF